jgi:hypothetical protein
MADKVLIVPIRQFNLYSVAYNKEFTEALGKPYWLTNENYVYYLGDKFSNEWVLVPRGFGTDGATVPPAFQGILPVFGKHGAAVILHDWLCENGYVWHMDKATGIVHKRVLTRKEIDSVFIEALTVVEMPADTIKLVNLGFIAYRSWANPSVPNPNIEKNKLEMNWAANNGVVPFSGEQLYDVVGHPPAWVFV